MSGYTPVFETIYDGTLHGKWPEAAVWASLLPLCNKDGEIRMTLDAIASRTGWPMKYLKKGIEGLMEPDPDSQSESEGGRRLILLDPRRTWGWKVVNHSKYREKARKKNYDDARTESGADRERKQALKLNSRDLPTPPDVSRAVPLSDTDTNTVRGARKRCPADFNPAEAEALTVIPDLDFTAELSRFKDYEFKTARKDWSAAWRNWLRTCKDTGRYSKKAAQKWY